MTSDQIVEASNHEYHRRVSNMWGDPKPSDDPADVPEIDKNTLEFAQSIWASRRRASGSEVRSRPSLSTNDSQSSLTRALSMMAATADGGGEEAGQGAEAGGVARRLQCARP